MFDVCKQAVDTVLAEGTVTPIPHQPPALILSLGPITPNPSSGSSCNNDEKKTFDLFKQSVCCVDCNNQFTTCVAWIVIMFMTCVL